MYPAFETLRTLTVSRVCIATVIQITFLAEGLTATDQTRAMMKPVIMQQLVMNLSILAAVVLSLHNFITNLTAGRFGVGVHESTDEHSKNYRGRTRRQTVASAPRQNTRVHSPHEHRLRARGSSAGFRPGRSNKSKAWAEAGEPNEWDDSDRVATAARKTSSCRRSLGRSQGTKLGRVCRVEKRNWKRRRLSERVAQRGRDTCCSGFCHMSSRQRCDCIAGSSRRK
jgi:hypothetical protein